MTGSELRRWRKAKGFTQADAAYWAGVDLRTWGRWERGERKVPAMLARLTRLTDLSARGHAMSR